jgi:hypothetical protein
LQLTPGQKSHVELIQPGMDADKQRFSNSSFQNFCFYFPPPGVASPNNPSGKVAMKDYVPNKKMEPTANETVWAFDLGKGFHGDLPSPRWGAVPRPSDGRGWRAATGEGCHCPDEVNKNLHHEFWASLLIPAEFAKTKAAAGRRRMWRTRQAHKAREQLEFYESKNQPQRTQSTQRTLTPRFYERHQSVERPSPADRV